jgi:hypothetical protein
MKSIIKILSILLFVFLTNAIYAQRNNDKLKLDVNYSFALPLGNFKTDVISDASPRGFAANMKYKISVNFSAGLGIGYQDFYQKFPRALYKTGDNEVTSAVLSNSVQLIPVIAKAYYLPMGSKKTFVQPYISAGAGIDFASFTQYLGEFAGKDNATKLIFQGAAGAFIPFSKTSPCGFNIGADYNLAGYNKFDIKNFNNLSAHIGIYIPVQ